MEIEDDARLVEIELNDELCAVLLCYNINAYLPEENGTNAGNLYFFTLFFVFIIIVFGKFTKRENLFKQLFLINRTM